MWLACSLRGSGVTEVEFFVEGKPAPQGSKSFRGMSKSGRAILSEASKSVGPWRKQVAEVAAELAFDPVPRGDPVSVWIEFILPRPKSTPKVTPAAVKRPDLDKLERAVLDAITGILIEDDSQVIRLSGRKRIAELGEMSGAVVRVITVSE